MLKAVLDTNVLVSAAIKPSSVPGLVVAEWRDGAFELVVSPTLLSELERALRSPKLGVYRDDIAALLVQLRADAVLVDDPPAIERIVPRDPDDDFIVAAARAGGAHVIVTGDRHLLEAEGLRPQAVTPRQFVSLLRAHGV